MTAGAPHADRGVARRAFLRRGAALAAGAVLPPVGGLGGVLSGLAGGPAGAGGALTHAGGVRVPGSLPFPGAAPGTDMLPGIDHIVVLMMENHSFDNLFGMLGRGDGFRLDRHGRPTATNPYPDGSRQHAFHMPSTCQLASSPSQEWAASHNAYSGGTNQGFVRTPISPLSPEIVGGVAMGYWTGEDIPFTYSLASAFPIGDRWFSSCLGQTDPQRRYLIAGTSAGMTDDIGASPFNGVSDATLALPAGGLTIFNQLDLHRISWVNYAFDYPTGATPSLFPVNDAATDAVHHRPLARFFTDAAAGALPAFTLLDPDYSTQSQENPQNIAVGDALIADVVHALGDSPQWPRCMLIITYDEHGGYYDHVAPPRAPAPDAIPPVVQPTESLYDGFARYGFRVPSTWSARMPGADTSATSPTTTPRSCPRSSTSGTCRR